MKTKESRNGQVGRVFAAATLIAIGAAVSQIGEETPAPTGREQETTACVGAKVTEVLARYAPALKAEEQYSGAENTHRIANTVRELARLGCDTSTNGTLSQESGVESPGSPPELDILSDECSVVVTDTGASRAAAFVGLRGDALPEGGYNLRGGSAVIGASLGPVDCPVDEQQIVSR